MDCPKHTEYFIYCKDCREIGRLKFAIMNDQQILKKAYFKAVINGWTGCHYGFENSDMIHKEYYVWLFSHGFAKAFWGTARMTAGLTWWEYHLCHMVLEENPINYLRGFLEEGNTKTEQK